MMSIKKIAGLDSIRFICAMWVVFGHLGFSSLLSSVDATSSWGWLVNNVFKALVSGPAAVIVFFVISGFCIHYPNRNAQKIEWAQYFIRRYLRIGIPVGVAILFAQKLNLSYIYYQDSIVWSLIAEIIYYTLYPVLLSLKGRFGWNKILLLSFILSLPVVLTNPTAGDYSSYGITLNWMLGLPCWLLGCKLAEGIDSLSETPSLKKIWNWRAAVWIISSLCMILRFRTSIGYPWTLNLFAIFVYFWIEKEILFFRSNSPSKFIEWCGAWSYSIYLMHMIAIKLFNHLNLPDGGNIVKWFGELFFALVIPYLFYRAVEKPAHALAQKFKVKKELANTKEVLPKPLPII